MTRRLFNLPVAVSLALCAATVALWVWSYRQEPGVYGVYVRHGNCYVQVFAFKGILTLNVVAGPHVERIFRSEWPGLATGIHLVRRGEYARANVGEQPPLPSNLAYTGVSASGSIWLINNPSVRMRIVTVAVPHAVIALIFCGIALALWWRSARRRVAGRCARCGYDLRATPGRCPECGTIPSAASR